MRLGEKDLQQLLQPDTTLAALLEEYDVRCSFPVDEDFFRVLFDGRSVQEGQSLRFHCSSKALRNLMLQLFLTHVLLAMARQPKLSALLIVEGNRTDFQKPMRRAVSQLGEKAIQQAVARVEVVQTSSEAQTRLALLVNEHKVRKKKHKVVLLSSAVRIREEDIADLSLMMLQFDVVRRYLPFKARAVAPARTIYCTLGQVCLKTANSVLVFEEKKASGRFWMGRQREGGAQLLECEGDGEGGVSVRDEVRLQAQQLQKSELIIN